MSGEEHRSSQRSRPAEDLSPFKGAWGAGNGQGFWGGLGWVWPLKDGEGSEKCVGSGEQDNKLARP